MNTPKSLSVALFALAALLAGNTAMAQSIFPDKNLEAAVRREVFEKRNNDQPITADDVKNISTIKGKNAGIKDLKGLEHCRSLAVLDLEGNEIADLAPIKDLSNIQTLTLAKNKITDLKPIEGLTKLQYLHLAENEIADLTPLAKLENMRSLYLSGNKIKELKPIASLTKTWSLYLDGNEINDINPLAELKKLDSLDLRGNAVADITPLAGLTEWKYLFLDKNKITDIGVLVEMAKKDREGDNRFALFWNVYLSGNPLSEEAKTKQLGELKAHSNPNRIHFE